MMRDMVDHRQNIGEAAADERLQNYKQNNLRHQRIRRLVELYDVNENHLLAMTKLAWTMRGCICYNLTSTDTYTLDESMNDWWDEHTAMRDELLEKGLITERRDKFHRLYYEVTNEGYDMLPETWRFDLGESFSHRLAVGRTAQLYLLRGHKVAMYPEIGTSGTHADLRVYPDDEQARQGMEVPGSKPLVVEVMTNHHNTQIVEDRFKTMNEAYEDGLWIMENQKTACKWLRRLQNRDVMDFGREYTWHPQTPSEAMHERVQATDYTGMQDVMTFTDITEKLSMIYAKEARIKAGLQAPTARPDSTSGMMQDIKSVLNG